MKSFEMTKKNRKKMRITAVFFVQNPLIGPLLSS